MSKIQDPSAELVAVHYYTSPVIAKLATRGQLSNDAQSRYIRALQARGASVTLGRHRLAKGFAPQYVEGQKASRQDQVKIWQLEEKETDVNIALGMYRAAVRSAADDSLVDQIVVVSGDTDLSPALRAIREDFPHIRLGVILPHRENLDREPPGSLANAADWMRRYVSNAELAANQLPPLIPLRNKPAIRKPEYW